MYLLADLAMQALSGVTSDPKHFDIDYIRAYSSNPNSTAVALAPISSPDEIDTSNLHGASHAPAGNPTTQAFCPETSGIIVYTAEFGSAPSATALNILLQFIMPQYTRPTDRCDGSHHLRLSISRRCVGIDSGAFPKYVRNV